MIARVASFVLAGRWGNDDDGGKLKGKDSMTGLRAHGGRVDLAASHYPDAPCPWLDLSTGINACAWAPDVLPQVDLTVLPSPAAIAALEAAAAAVFGTSADRVVALPGSEMGLRSLACLDLPSPMRFVVRSYGTHAEAVDGAIQLEREAIGDTQGGTILLANPNNPDGRLDRPGDLLAVARRGVWVVVDEAFADVRPEMSIVPHLSDDDRVVVFRSFGKFFGLPGVRLGFMIAPPAQVAAMRRRLGSWPVSAHAVAYGTAAYRDTRWIDAARVAIVDRATRLDAMLRPYGDVRGDCPLFRLIEGEDAPALFERLARAGILTRPFDYAPQWLRVGVPGDDAEFERLDRALARD
jgi:cobalamin biosynthetic protein CobC